VQEYLLIGTKVQILTSEQQLRLQAEQPDEEQVEKEETGKRRQLRSVAERHEDGGEEGRRGKKGEGKKQDLMPFSFKRSVNSIFIKSREKQVYMYIEKG